MPKVSIVTPCYNGARFVGQTIQSVQAQSLQDWEHIVIDDSSTDDSASIVQEYVRRDPRIRLIVCERNGGVCPARNRGVRACDGSSRFLYFLDADDCAKPDMLATMVRYLDAHPEAGMAFCGCDFIDADDRHTPANLPNRWVPSGLLYRAMDFDTPNTSIISLLSTWIVPSVSCIRRSVYVQTPGWDETLSFREDTDLFLQLALRSEIHFVPEKHVLYRRHPSQFTADGGRVKREYWKLVAKWRSAQGLSRAQRDTVRRAFRFREGRVIPSQGVVEGIQCVRRGAFVRAGRLFAGSARRYICSVVAPSRLAW